MESMKLFDQFQKPKRQLSNTPTQIQNLEAQIVLNSSSRCVKQEIAPTK